MKKCPAPANPDEYVRSLRGWTRTLVEKLRSLVLATERTDEVVKWGHLVYFSDGPVLLIRAEPERVLFGFWRGQRLVGIEPRLKPGGKYEMATAVLGEGDEIDERVVRKLVADAVELNGKLGDPTKLTKA